MPKGTEGSSSSVSSRVPHFATLFFAGWVVMLSRTDADCIDVLPYVKPITAVSRCRPLQFVRTHVAFVSENRTANRKLSARETNSKHKEISLACVYRPSRLHMATKNADDETDGTEFFTSAARAQGTVGASDASPAKEESGGGGGGNNHSGVMASGNFVRRSSVTASRRLEDNQNSQSAGAGGANNNDVSLQRTGQLRRETRLPIRFVIDRLRLSVDSSELTSDFIKFVPFLALFIFYFIVGRDIEGNFYVLRSVREAMFRPSYPFVTTQLALYQQQVLAGERLWLELDKDYPTIGNAGDWQSWATDTLVPSIWDCTPANSSTRYAFLAPVGQNFHLGSLRIRTQHVSNTSCTVLEDLYPANTTLLPRACYSGLSTGSETKDGLRCNQTNPLDPTGPPLFAYKQCSDIPGVPISAIEGIYHCGGYMVEIPFSASCDQAKAVVSLAANDCFVNQWSTRFVAVEYFVYTPSTDSFHSIKLYNEAAPPGAWTNQWQFRSFQVYSSSDAAAIALEFVFLAYVLYWVFVYIYDGVRAYRNPELSLLGYITDFWSVLELTNLICFIAMFIIRWSWWSVSNSAANNLALPFPDGYPPYLDRLQVLYESQVYGGAVNTILIFLKLLKYVRLNSKLNVLTRTLAACQQSILGILVLFITVIFGYAITGWSLFGVNIRGFRSLGVSMSSLVRMLVGDIDYEAMRNENRFLAGAFFWTFIILALFLLLNFLIAVITESFAQTSGKAFSQPFDEVVLRAWQQAKSYFRPSNVARMLRNVCKGKSEPVLLRDVIAQLEEKQKALLLLAEQERINRYAAAQTEMERILAMAENTGAGEAESEDLVAVMCYDDINLWLSEDTYQCLSEHYFTYTWDNLMNEYDDMRKGTEETEKRRMAETVETVVKSLMADEIARVDQLDELLSNMDMELDRLMRLYGINNTTSTAF